MKKLALGALLCVLMMLGTSSIALATPTPTRTPMPISTPTPVTFRPVPTAVPVGSSPLATLRANVDHQLLSDRIISIYKTLNFEMVNGLGVLDVISFVALSMFSLKILVAAYKALQVEQHE